MLRAENPFQPSPGRRAGVPPLHPLSLGNQVSARAGALESTGSVCKPYLFRLQTVRPPTSCSTAHLFLSPTSQGSPECQAGEALTRQLTDREQGLMAEDPTGGCKSRKMYKAIVSVHLPVVGSVK